LHIHDAALLFWYWLKREIAMSESCKDEGGIPEKY